MSGCDRMRPTLGAYVLGALDVDEAAEVRRHIADCPDCAAEHDSLAALPELLSVAGGAEAATAEPLPAAFEERLLDAYARDRVASPRRRRRLPRLRNRVRLQWMAAGAASAALAAAAVIAVVLVIGGEDQAPRYDLTLENTAAAPGARARARLDSVSSGTELHLWVRGMRGNPRAVYEVLCEAPTWTASAGTFRVDVSGRAYVVLNTAARRGEYDSIRVVRRARGPDGEMSRREVLRAKLS
jgi:anti-sigma-K factor RskA